MRAMSAVKIVAQILEIAEQVMPAVGQAAKIDRVVADVAIADRLQHARPDGRVQPHVFVEFLGPDAESRLP